MNRVSWTVRNILLLGFSVIVLVAQPILSKVYPVLEDANPYLLGGILFVVIVIVGGLVGFIAGGFATDHQMSTMMEESRRIQAEFSRDAEELRKLLAQLPASLTTVHQQMDTANRALLSISNELSLSLKVHYQIVKEHFGQSLITYQGMADIEKKVPDGEEIWILTSALQLEEQEFADIIQANLSRGVRYTYLIPKEESTPRERMVRLAKKWQQVCHLSRDNAMEQIRCILVPGHFAYMTVAIYAPYHTYQTVLVKFPASEVFSELTYPLIYRVDRQTTGASEVFIKALKELIKNPCDCSKKEILNLEFHE